MKKHTAWWTKFAGAVKHQQIIAIQNDARPKWYSGGIHGNAPANEPLIFITDRREVCTGWMDADGKITHIGPMRGGKDTKVDFVAYMYVKDFLDCGLLQPPPKDDENGSGDNEADSGVEKTTVQADK